MAMNKVKHRSTMFTNSWLRQREIGQMPAIGSTDKFMKGIYTSILPSTSWDHKDSLHCGIPGGVFNLEFSPDGSLLVAACEKRSILMFDPLSRQMIHAVDNAHNDCVNCVRFLDSRVFATCSDDSTVALWDARNLRSRIRTLQGHSNWVKNIEFSQSEGLLVTSGFDGSIYTWDINSYTESGFLYNRVFHTNGLMRTRLNPDASKMIICTTGGYLILIHNLDLKTLKDDLEGFKPNMYRLMQLSQTTIPVAANYTHLFSHKRKTNRIEFITDFPERDDAEVVSSLQVHPQGWCVLSRNISNDETSEWTCIHDIQEQDYQGDESDDVAVVSESEDEENTNDRQEMVFIGSDARARIIPTYRRHAISDPSLRFPYSRRVRTFRSQSQPFRGFPSTVPTVSRVVEGRRELTVTSADVWEALVAIREARSRRERDRMEAERRRAGNFEEVNEPETRLRIVRMASGLNPVARESRGDSRDSSSSRSEDEDDRPTNGSGSQLAAGEPPAVTSIVIRYRRSPQEQQAANVENVENVENVGSDLDPEIYGRRALLVVGGRERNLRIVQTRQNVNRLRVPRNHRIHLNSPRLTHFIEEPNVGKGFIKELCFSSDGRLICSPFGYGVRLLAFSSECSELSTCVPKSNPMPLHELGTNVCHADIVVSTKFSPRHCLFVSGCLTGRIVWHQPVV